MLHSSSLHVMYAQCHTCAQVLNLASNNLRGTHPIQWSGMTNLQAVYLSGNNFDGKWVAIMHV